jgi:hypothetical protein
VKKLKRFVPLLSLLTFLLLPTLTRSAQAATNAADEVGVPAKIEIAKSPEITGLESRFTPPDPTGSPTQATRAASRPFTATLGLDTFSAYRLNLSGEFDGTRDGQPSSGTVTGFLDVTKQPAARHLSLVMEGETFSDVAPLGTMEAFEINNSYFIQNPRSGAWMTVPGFLVNIMLPDGVPAPEDEIDLPLTAVPQPGREIVNGLVTRRYTFGPTDLAQEVRAKYDHVEGEIWVAVDGNYVVRYEASVTGQSDHLKSGSQKFGRLIGGDLTLPDEGTMTIRYELSDIDGDVRIALPQGVGGGNSGFSLGSLFGW